MSDPRLLGYHTLARALWLAGQALGLDWRGLEVLREISLVSAVLCLWLVRRILVRRLAVAPVPALLASVLLGVCYGYWRYAVEADVYALAMLLCAWVLYLLLDEHATQGRHAAAAGALAGLAMLVYQPNAIPLLMAFPLLLWRGGRAAWRAAVRPILLYGTGAGLVLAGGYLLGFWAYWPEPWSASALVHFLRQRSEEFMVPPLSLHTVAVSIVRSALALGHDIASSNFVFGLPGAEQAVRRLFGSNVIEEELFLARQAGRLVYLPLLLLPALGWCGWRVVRAARPLGAATWRAWPVPVLLLWAALTALVIGRLNPGGIEAWIVMLLPLALLLAVLVLAPAWAHQGAGAIGLLLAVLALHNAVGGMALVQSRDGDLTYRRGEWVVGHASARDLVLVTDDANLAEALRYLAPARVLRIGPSPQGAQHLAAALWSGGSPRLPVLSIGRDFDGADVHAAAVQALAAGGRIILFGNFFLGFEQPIWVRGSERAAALAFRAASLRVHTAPDGSTTHVFARPPEAPGSAEAAR